MKRYINDILTKILTLTLLLLAGANVAWGQNTPNYSGTYYIAFGGKISETPYSLETPSTNYYLCPTEGWCYYEYSNNMDNFTSTDNGQPFLTTHKCKNDNNYDINKAKWTILKHESEDFYYIKQGSNYIIFNGPVNTAGENRIRVHLEEPSSLDDKALYEITPNKNGGLKIRPKTKTGYWLNVTNGNDNSLKGVSGKTGGPTGYVDVGGIIGIWNEDNYEARCYLEDYITRPTVGYDDSDNNKIVITNKTTSSSGTVFYTTNGDDPTLETSERTSFTTASVAIESFTDNTVIKAVAKVGNEYSNVVTFTAFVHVGSSNQYLIQTLDGGSFYLVPPITTESNVSTTNIPHAKMAWYFTDAGQESGVQYYNIVNNNTAEYLYCSTNKGADKAFVMKASNASGTVADRFKFALIASGSGFKVIPKIHLYETTGMCMSKKNGNNATDYLNLSNGTDNDYNSLWKVVSLPSASDPKTLFDASFASTITNYKAYQIQCASAPNTHLVPPAAVDGNLIASTSTEGNIVWSFEDTGESDTWIAYYYLRNRTTGDYVYFNGTADGGENTSTFLTSTAISSGSEDKYKFIVVKAANTTYPDSYNIIPKLLKDKVNQEKNSLSKTSSTALKTLNSRAVDGTLWYLVEDNNFTIISPVVTYGSGVVSMSCATPGTTIKYTTGTTDPSIVYDDSNKPAYADNAQIFIKAIAVVGNNASSDVTLIKNPDISFTEGSEFPYTGSAIVPTVSSVTVTSDAIIIDDSEYDIAYSNNTDVGEATVTISDATPTNNIFISGTSQFTITQKSLGNGSTAADGIVITLTKTGENTYGVTVKYGTITLIENTDYTVTGTSDESGYVATITAKKEGDVYTGNYSGGAKAVYVRANFPTLTSDTDGGFAAPYQATTDLAAPSGLKAYIVTGIDYSAEAVEVQELDYIPQDVPVLLLTEDGVPHDADFTTTLYVVGEGGAADVTANKLCISDGTISADWGQYYIFSKGEFVLSMGAKENEEPIMIKAGKYYFENEKYDSGSTQEIAPSRLLFLSRGTTDVNGVVDKSAISSKEEHSKCWYTLRGQKLARIPFRKGIYIQNGRKLIVK